MALLKFKAKPGHTVLRPGLQMPGQHPAFVGMVRGESGDYTPSDAPFECEENSPEAMRLKKLVAREGALDPVDEYTAAACGVPFVEAVAEEPKKKAVSK